MTYAEIRRIWPPLIKNTPTVRQASVSLLIGLLGFLGSGLILAKLTDVLVLVPGLITLLPASNALRGNIYAPLGSRLGTYLHSGLIRPTVKRSKVLDQNVLATSSQSLLTAFLLSGSSWALLHALGLPVIPLEDLLFVALCSAAVAGLLLTFAAFILSSVAFRRGFDPDNLNAPLITAGGDFLSAILIMGSGLALLSTQFSPVLVLPVDAAGVVATALLLRTTLSLARPIARQIFKQTLVVLASTVMVELVVGFALEASLATFAVRPVLLALIPPFVGESGNLASIHSSRLSSAMHLGVTRMARKPDAFALADIRDMSAVALAVFPFIGAAVILLAGFSGVGHPDPLQVVALCLIAGAIITAVVLPLGYYTTLLAVRLGVDPDNVVIPITNSVIDVIGVAVLLGASGAFGLH